jgi:undecaprenyl-diphosphatase
MTAPGETPRSPARWLRFFAARLDRESYLGLHLTIGLIVIALGVWLFGSLLEEVLDNDALVRSDMAMASWIHSMTTPIGLKIFIAITNIGSPVVMATISGLGAVTMFVKRHRLLAAAWAAAAAGGAVLDYLLKTTVHRTRPEYAAAFLHGSSYSFPSGHAMGSLIGYGFLAYAFVLTRQRRGWRGQMVYSLAALLALLIGVSRVYIGVHYPSDVVGGWAAGLAWLAVCITGYQVVSGRTTLRSSTKLPSPTP